MTRGRELIEGFEPELALKVLIDHGVRFVVIGGVAGNVLGSTLITNDLDICYARDPANLGRLVAALHDVNAELPGPGIPPELPFQLDIETFERGDSFTFMTDVGSLDCLGMPAGSAGYDSLARNATEVRLDVGMSYKVCSLEDLTAMKAAAGRPQDRAALELLEALRIERERLADPDHLKN